MVAEDFLDLADSERPGRPLPGRLRSLLPDPMKSLEEWRRFHHEDVEDLDPAERRWEAVRLRVAAASLGYERVPAWVLSRLAVLGAK